LLGAKKMPSIKPIDAQAAVGDTPWKMKSKIQEALLFALANTGAGLAIYFTGVGSAHLFGNTQSVFSPIWPAGGVALAALLLLGARVWPSIFLPLFLTSHAGGHPWLFSLLAPAGMTFFVSMAAKLLKDARFDIKFTSTRDVLLLAGFGAALPMGLAGFWNAACLILSGMMPPAGLWSVGSIYWAMNTAGTVVVAPVILLLASGRFWPKKMRFHEAASTCVQLGCVFASAWLAFHGKHSEKASLQALAYLPFPFLVWVALTRGLPAAALSVLFIVFTAVTYTSRGCGPFVSNSVVGTIWQIEVFIAIVSTTGLLIAAGSESQKREKSLQAIAAKKTAELERLTAQVNPHFLFNCLNVIHALILTDTQAAQTGVTSLAKLLRNTLDLAKEPLIPLSKELDIIRESLRLQKMRYEDGLEWSVCADAGSEEFPVPPMLLQPLVENAINYGVVEGFGRVELHAQIEAEDLIVHIRNTAPPECDPSQWKENIGLASVRARIEDMCPLGSGIVFSRTPEGVIEALVRIKRVISKKS
jgi:integral membrane sensor domain MASE1